MRLRRTTAILTVAVLATILGLVAPTPAVAAASHFNTDPYATGCNNNAWIIHTRYVGGGRLDTFYSGSCQTNWVQWSGPRTCTFKRVRTQAKGWNRWEKDYASWSYSMQVYAPGNTKIQVEYAVTPTSYPTCGGSAWDLAHEVGQHSWITLT